jgi:hypothetical protein
MACGPKELEEIYCREDMSILIGIVELLASALESDKILFEEHGMPERGREIDWMLDNVVDASKKCLAFAKEIKLAEQRADIADQIARCPPFKYVEN